LLGPLQTSPLEKHVLVMRTGPEAWPRAAREQSTISTTARSAIFKREPSQNGARGVKWRLRLALGELTSAAVPLTQQPHAGRRAGSESLARTDPRSPCRIWMRAIL
jgi:hypothetical protein